MYLLPVFYQRIGRGGFVCGGGGGRGGEIGCPCFLEPVPGPGVGFTRWRVGECEREERERRERRERDGEVEWNGKGGMQLEKGWEDWDGGRRCECLCHINGMA